MKAFSTIFVLLYVCLSVACAESEQSKKSIAQKMLKPLIEQQCGRELEASKLWQVSSLLWSKAQQNSTQQKICGCVSENALNDMSNKEILMATVNETSKNQLIQHAVLNSLKECIPTVIS